MFLLESLQEAIILGDKIAAVQLTKQALQTGIGPMLLFNEALIPAMDRVGAKMQNGEYYIPEVLRSAKAMKSATEVLRPLLVKDENFKPKGTVVIGTVQGDLHDIGKQLVIMMLEGAGFRCIDLGTNVPAREFVVATENHGADIVAMSALLTTTMLNMPVVIEQLQKAGFRNDIKIMIGGAPVSETFAQEIGANGYGKNASSGVALAKKWTGN
jgi:corrinoid protein of di/trimethylamine methyltransferase